MLTSIMKKVIEVFNYQNNSDLIKNEQDLTKPIIKFEGKTLSITEQIEFYAGYHNAYFSFEKIKRVNLRTSSTHKKPVDLHLTEALVWKRVRCSLKSK